MQRSGMGVGFRVFGASAFVSGAGVLALGVLGAWGSLALKRGTFALSSIGVSGHWGVWV